MPQDRILVVDHEPKSVHLLNQVLTSAGYVVIVANKGEKALQLTAEQPADLLLIELRLRGEMNGVELLRRIRQFSDVPVILLAANPEPEELLRGFDAGADDYYSKPFDPRILLARMRAVLQRCRGGVVSLAEIVLGTLTINMAARQVFHNGVEIYLTETEYNLLLELAKHRNQVLVHEDLLKAVWGNKVVGEVDYLRSYIHILRRKLEVNPSQPRLILSRPGIGYMLVSSPSEGGAN